MQGFVATLCVLGFAATTFGQTTWGPTGGGNWNVNTNWSSGTFPNATNASAVLGTSITANSLITLGQDITVGSLTFNDNNNYILRSNTLIFNTGGGAALLLVTNSGGNGAHTISNAIQLSNNLVVSQGSTGLLTMSGAKSGAGGLTKEGTNRLALSGVASYTGATLINDGRIDYNSDGAIPAGSAVTIGDGVGAAGSATLAIVGAAIGFSNALALTIASDGLLLQGPTRLVRISSLSGTSPTGELRINNIGGVQGVQFVGNGASNNSTYSGRITLGGPGAPPPSADFNGGSRINKSGTATLTLDGSNSYIAPTFISGGALRAASSNALGAAGISNATYVFSAGALELAGNVSIAEPLFLNGQGDGAGALRSVSGSNTVTGALSIGWTGASGVTASNASFGAAANSTLVIGTQITSTNAAIGLTKYGAGTVIFNSNNTYTGSTVVNAGTLRLAAASNALAGNLQIQTNASVTLGASEQIADTAAITNAGGTLSMGSFNETVASFTMTGGLLQGAGTLTAANYSLTAGTVNANLGAGSLNKTTTDVATIAAGRTVSVTNATISAGTLVVNGALTGTTTVTNAGTIAGTGSVGTLNINGGGVLSPGNSPGTITATNGATWSQGGAYTWEIFSLVDNPGTSWDLLDVTAGTLNLAGITTTGGFTINLITLQADATTPGALTGFNPLSSYNNWLIAQAPTITGFVASRFLLNDAGFVGAAGTFGIEQRAVSGGQGLFLTYSPAVPEPGTWAAGALLLGVGWLVTRRRRVARS